MSPEERTFEKAFTRLERLVRDLEAGQITLEQALELYAEGVELIKFCRNKLERAEQQMAVLSEGMDGKPVLEYTALVEGGSSDE